MAGPADPRRCGAQLKSRRKDRAHRALRCLASLALLLTTGAAVARDRPLVWALHGPTNTVYIAGSMHLLRPEDSLLSDNLNRAYADAERIVMEIDMDDLDENALAAETLQLASYPPQSHQTLRGALGEERWNRINAQTEAAGLPLAALDGFKPWMVGLTFSVLQMRQLGLDPKLGVEQQLAARAKADHKPITGLETAQQQLAIFDALPDALQLRFLDQTLEESKDAPRELAQMTRAWKRGDEKQLASELLEEYAGFPELYDALVWKRNQAWVPQIEALLTGHDDYLVVVGALHLIGDRGVIQLLKRDGLTPQRLSR